MSIVLQFQRSCLRVGQRVLSVMWESQSVGGERWGRGLQGAGGVRTSHVREEVGVRAQLVNVEPVLLAVGQTAPDKCLQNGGGHFRKWAAGCVCVCLFVCLCVDYLYLCKNTTQERESTFAFCLFGGKDCTLNWSFYSHMLELIQMVEHVSTWMDICIT